jgi:hypothetical protein
MLDFPEQQPSAYNFVRQDKTVPLTNPRVPYFFTLKTDWRLLEGGSSKAIEP